jgi:hypothetical protein
MPQGDTKVIDIFDIFTTKVQLVGTALGGIQDIMGITEQLSELEISLEDGGKVVVLVEARM